jgi:hypothetical protein
MYAASESGSHLLKGGLDPREAAATWREGHLERRLRAIVASRLPGEGLLLLSCLHAGSECMGA